MTYVSNFSGSIRRSSPDVPSVLGLPQTTRVPARAPSGAGVPDANGQSDGT